MAIQKWKEINSMAKNPNELANEILKEQVFKDATDKVNAKLPNHPGVIYPHNKEDFLKRHGIDKFYEFDGGDLVDLDDMHTTTVRVGNNGAQEDWLLDRIEELGKWKRPLPKAKDIHKEPEKLLGSKSKFAQKYPDRYEKLKNYKIYGDGRTAEDVDWDNIAGILGVDLD